MRIPTKKETILLYGQPGSGKTYLAGTVAEKYYTLFFDVEHGSKTLQNLPEETQDNIIVLEYTDFSDLNEVYKRLSKHNTKEEWDKFFKIKGLDIQVKKPFEAVVLDSLSDLQRQMEKELSNTSVTTALASPQNVGTLRIQDWGAVSTLTEMVVADAFGNLPMIFITTAHEQVNINSETGNIILGHPKLRGQLAQDIGKHFNFVGRLGFAKTGQRVVFTKTANGFQAKTRGNQEPIMINPKMKDII